MYQRLGREKRRQVVREVLGRLIPRARIKGRAFLTNGVDGVRDRPIDPAERNGSFGTVIEIIGYGSGSGQMGVGASAGGVSSKSSRKTSPSE